MPGVLVDIANRSADQILANEDGYMDDLLSLADERSGTVQKITITRPRKDSAGNMVNRLVLEFQIGSLDERAIEAIRLEATTPGRLIDGVRQESRTDAVMYRSLLIYRSTVAEDRKRVWDNEALKAKLGVTMGYMVIDKLLFPGEKAYVMEQIDEISRYGFAPDLEVGDAVKN